MGKKLIACVFSDLHIHNYNQYNPDSRRLHLKFDIIGELVKLEVPILFCGDFFHEDQQITNKVLDECSKRLPNMFGERSPLYGISGNHDMSDTNSTKLKSPSLFSSICRLIPNMFDIDFNKVVLRRGINVYGLPYLSYNIGFKDYIKNLNVNPGDKNILLIHTDLHGAKDTDGRLINSVDNIDKDMVDFFDKFDLVLSGHIHKPQIINPKLIMVGAPDQQRKSDMGGKFGFWELYSDMTYEFVRLKFPEFREYDPAKDKTDDFHYWVPINSDKQDDIFFEEKRFTNNVSRNILAKRYCNEKGIKDKKKIKALKEVLNDKV